MAMHHRRVSKRQTEMLRGILAELELYKKESKAEQLEVSINALASFIVSEGHIKGRR